jgi:hypothetical protein
MEVPSLKDTQLLHWSQASPSAVFVSQLMVLARIRAQVVFPRPAKQKSVRQLVVADGIFERGGNMRLSHNCIKVLGPVLSCRNDEFIHLHCEHQNYEKKGNAQCDYCGRKSDKGCFLLSMVAGKYPCRDCFGR